MASAAVQGDVDKKVRKTRRKLKRLVKQAQEDLEIEVSEQPTEYVLVSNVGIVTGARTEDLVNLFSPFGPVKALMVAGKTFSFVTFEDVNQSLAAYQAIHGKTPQHLKHACYLAFITKIPQLKESMEGPVEQFPPGLILINDFISTEKEIELEQMITWSKDDESSLKHRQVKHFGYKFCYESNNVDVNQPLSEKIPEACLELLKNLLETHQLSHVPDQLTVNRYLPGQGIPLHVDTHSAFEDEILSLSIGSPVVMEFKHYDGRHVNVLLPSRSLLIMSKESRYAWKHGICPRKTDVIPRQLGGCPSTISHRGTRISFTFRKIRCRPCQCQFKPLCDSQSGVSAAPKSHNTTSSEVPAGEEPLNFENSHVHQVYDMIADHFSSTRYKPWPKIAEFIEALPVGSLMLDIGCGNGKYLGINSNIFKIGCDRSTKLVSICEKKGFQSFCSDALALPIRSQCFDVCICIAVIHHLSTLERRQQAMNELSRILKSNGKALIYVWAMDQSADGTSSNYIRNRKVDDAISTDKMEEQSLPIHCNRSNFEHQDLFVPWKMKPGKNTSVDSENQEQSQTFYRYYHMFEKGELESLCEMVEDLRLLQSYYDKGNWCVVVEKQ